MDPTPALPRTAVGALVIKDDKVLLVRRARPPNEGLWSLPGGKQHWGETLAQAVEREVLEETAVAVRAGAVIHCFDLITAGFHYVIIDLLADYLGGEPQAGDDAGAARWQPLDALDRLPLEQNTRDLLRARGLIPGTDAKKR